MCAYGLTIAIGFIVKCTNFVGNMYQPERCLFRTESDVQSENATLAIEHTWRSVAVVAAMATPAIVLENSHGILCEIFVSRHTLMNNNGNVVWA